MDVFGLKDNTDELDDYLCKQEKPTEAGSLKTEHIIREQVTVSPLRRKLLRLVGVFGIEEKQLKEESELNDFFFKFHMGFLLKEGFLKLEDRMYRLTDTGIAMHDSVC
jgi:hypothetical protein